MPSAVLKTPERCHTIILGVSILLITMALNNCIWFTRLFDFNALVEDMLQLFNILLFTLGSRFTKNVAGWYFLWSVACIYYFPSHFVTSCFDFLDNSAMWCSAVKIFNEKSITFSIFPCEGVSYKTFLLLD